MSPSSPPTNKQTTNPRTQKPHKLSRKPQHMEQLKEDIIISRSVTTTEKRILKNVLIEMEEIASENQKETPSPGTCSLTDREGKSKGHICMSGSI